MNEICDYRNRECKLGCRSDTACELDEYCDVNTDKCTKGCRSDESCDSNSYCDSETKECKVGCRDDESCGFKEYCDNESRLCMPGCATHDVCADDEYCVLKEHKCIGICEVSACGDNSKCTVKDRNQYCSCDDGYFPEGGLGCRPIAEDDNFNNKTCALYCEKYAACAFEDETVYCFCPLKLLPISNPYIKCTVMKHRLSAKTVKTLMYG